MLAPEVETRPWPEQLALDDESYRAQLAYLFERSAFYREKLAGLETGGLDDIARLPLTEKQELRETVTPENPIGAHLCVTGQEIVRIYSTSGTTGSPSFIPLTRSDLDNWVTGSARSYAASGIAAGQRIVSTYNAGPFVAGAALEAFDRIGLSHIPVGTGNTERLVQAIEALRPEAAVLTPSYAAYLAENFDLRSSSVTARPRCGRARRRRAGVPREARGGLGRARHRGDGHRRHRRLALGRVRGAGRDAPRRARLRPRGARRAGDRRGSRAGGRRERRARPHPPAAPRRPAPALPHARPRGGTDEPVPVWPHRPAHPLHRAHRRHADRARGQRLPLGRARGRLRVREGQRPRPRPSAGGRREAGTAAAGRRRARARRRPGPGARGRDP